MFNISGIIQEPKPYFKNNTNISLKINLYSSNKKTTEIKCIIYYIIENNYTLNCKLNGNLEGDLQGSVSYINKDLLIIIFEPGFDSKINSKEIDNLNNYIYYSRKSGGVNNIVFKRIITPDYFNYSYYCS